MDSRGRAYDNIFVERLRYNMADMGWIGPRRRRREVAGPAAGPMGPTADRPPHLQPAAIFHFHPMVKWLL